MDKSATNRRAFVGAMAGAGAAALAGGETAQAHAAPRRKITRARPGAPFSRAVEYGGIVFVAGVVGRAPGQQNVGDIGFETQCRQAMENLKASVEAAGSTMKNVMKCNCFLTDFADFPAMNSIFRTYFPADPPARSTVVVKELVVPGAKIEIDCTTCID